MSSSPVRLIATDVDGTLLSGKGIIPPQNINAIHAAQEKGITVAIASGRFPENVFVMMQDNGIKCPIIGVNGAEVTDGNLRLLYEKSMSASSALSVLDVLERTGSDFFMFGHKCICTSMEGVLHHSELSYGERIRALGFTYYHGFREARAIAKEGNTHKFFVCSNVPLPPVRQALKAVTGIELTQSAFNNVEVMPVGVDKGKGVEKLAAALGIPLSQVMALGDESNDIPMLSIVGFGVAMANGSQEAKEAARYVTASNDACGFAQAVEKYAL